MNNKTLFNNHPLISNSNQYFYEKKYIFDYAVKVELIKSETNKPYASFFKYY